MKKHKYVNEYEINAAAHLIFPYLSTASGLQEWLAEQVEPVDDKHFRVVWDVADDRLARIASRRTNSHVKYQFVESVDESRRDLPYVEFRLGFNDLTQTCFIKVTDYSEMDDEGDLTELWGTLIRQLRICVGATVE